MYEGKFSLIVANNFEQIKKNFISGLKKSDYDWNEDIFMDAYIKCDAIFGDKIIDEKYALKYFWTSYINLLKNYYKSPYNKTVPIPVDYNAYYEEYDNDKDILYGELFDLVKTEFGKDAAKAWVDYKCRNKTCKEIVQEYNIENFPVLLKKIKRFVNKKMSTTSYIQELVYNVRN